MAHWRSAWRYANRVPEIARTFVVAQRPVALILDYLQMRPWRPRQLELRNGVRIHAATYEDLVTTWIIFCRREYRIPAGASTVLDIGANIGCFTLMAASERPASRIVCVEPFPPTYARLLENVLLNDLTRRVDPWPVGVAARAETRVIPAGDWPSQSLGMLPSGSPEGDGTPIECLPIDDVLHGACDRLGVAEIDFVKMDVEGAEHESLRAVTRAGIRRVREFAMEYHPNGEKAGLFDALTRHGFELVHDSPINPAAGIAHFRRVGPA